MKAAVSHRQDSFTVRYGWQRTAGSDHFQQLCVGAWRTCTCQKHQPSVYSEGDVHHEALNVIAAIVDTGACSSVTDTGTLDATGPHVVSVALPGAFGAASSTVMMQPG